MNRREFNLQLAAGSTLALGAGAAIAQGEPVEGREYTRLKEPVAVAATGKVELIEFFGYWCPHCAAFEPVPARLARQGTRLNLPKSGLRFST